MNLNEFLKDMPQHRYSYYPNSDCSEELGLIDYEQTEVRRRHAEWATDTTLWMMAFAILLWFMIYLMVMTIIMGFDFSFRSVATFTRFIRWYNETYILTSDNQTTRYILSY